MAWAQEVLAHTSIRAFTKTAGGSADGKPTATIQAVADASDANKAEGEDAGDQQVHFHAETLLVPVEALQTKMEREWTSEADCPAESMEQARQMVRGLLILLKSFVSAVKVEESVGVPTNPNKKKREEELRKQRAEEARLAAEAKAKDEAAAVGTHFGAQREALLLPL